MDYIAVKIGVSPEKIDELTGVLVMQGFMEFEIEDPRDFDYILSGSVYYDYIDEHVVQGRENCSVTVYLPDNAQGGERRELLVQTVQTFGSLPIAFSLTKEEDWANNWKAYFKPLPVGKRLIIKPSWEELPGNNDRIVLEIDPSTSFGTGGHATTKLCLEALEREISGGEDVLDMGCGSGILGVGAMLLGAKSVCAVDIEENAVTITKQNALRNDVLDGFSLHCGNVTENADLAQEISRGGYDIIAANIVADVIIAMAGLFKTLLRPSGMLLCSGIIVERRENVIDALKSNGFHIKSVHESEGWVALVVTHND